mgnify:CR=1 FL=1
MRQLLLLAAKRDRAANAIDRLVASDIDQPRPRIDRQIGGRPALQRHRKCILQRVLGEIEIADEADQRRQRPARLVAEDFFDLGAGSCDFIHCRFGRIEDADPEFEIPDAQSRIWVHAARAPE